VGRKNHNPSITRKIVRDLKQGHSPESLFSAVKNITDPYYCSLSYFHLASFGFKKIKQTNEVFDLGFKNVNQVSQSWRRLELLGEISKIFKKIVNSETLTFQYKSLISKVFQENKSDSNDFLVKYSKNFPSSMFGQMLAKATILEGYEFSASKAIIRTWIPKGDKKILINDVLALKSNIKVKLLGYIHLQFSKLKTDLNPTALELALGLENIDEYLTYLVRVCFNSQDFKFFSKLSLPPNIILALAIRADRKGFSNLYEKYLLEAKEAINSLKSSDLKENLLIKYQKAKHGSSKKTIIEEKSSQFNYSFAEKGNHTLGLYNTYGGNWNHPHFKAIYKASKLCSAFDLDLALIGFPSTSSEKLMKEVNKEMRVTKDDFLHNLFSLNRVLFFDKEIDESRVGKKVITTSNPDSKKIDLPNGKLCMIMGLGPKGLPASYVRNSQYHFELTGSNVAFETGTAMGSICSVLSQR